MQCLDETALVDLADGTLDPRGRVALEAHVDGCAHCALMVAELARAMAPDGAATVPTRGSMIGRYRVESWVGAGAMGEVFAARDTELDRLVALKLAPPAEDAEVERHLREARTLARIRHPNVVTVHDAGMHGGRAFLAMELIEGTTLRGLAAQRRSWREAVGLYLQAARGLAAAHAAGVVHRDFKPDNVVVGDDGRVQVIDFGLARADLAVGTPVRGGTGRVGTPGYMAPEVTGGGSADERSDQYACCVALSEALTGVRPTAGSAGPAGVPRPLAAAIARGLAADPAERHGDLTVLIAKLAAALEPSPRRWLWPAAVAVVGLAAIAIAIVMVTGGDHGAAPVRCDGDRAATAALWNPPRRAALRQRFLDAGRPHGAATWARVDEDVEGRVERMIATRRDACRASRVQHVESDQVMALRYACVRRRQVELAALLDALGGGDATVVDRALEATSRLPDVDLCSADRVLTERRELAPDVAAAVERGLAELARLQALLQLGRRAEATAGLGRVLDEARAIDDPEILADAYRLRASVLSQDGATAAADEAGLESLLAAERLGDPRRTARAALELADNAGRVERGADAQRWVRQAAAALDRAGDEPRLQISLRLTRGRIAVRNGEPELAARELTEALGLVDELERGHGREPTSRALVAQALAEVHVVRGDAAAAIALLETTRAAIEAAAGPEHPLLGGVLFGLASAYAEAERYPESLALHQRIVTLREGIYGVDSPLTGIALTNLAVPLMHSERAAEAEQALTRALAIFEAVHDDGRAAQALINLASAAAYQEHHAAAVAHARRALALLEHKLGSRHLYVGHALVLLGDNLCRLGRCREAIEPLERGVTILAAQGPGPNLQVAQDQLAHARGAIARRRVR